ncbi:DUF2116 family Zn-ribbon domain-containing protein [Aquibacillus saliphilus]
MNLEEKEICVNCGKPINNNSSFCSDECNFNYGSDN